MSFTYELHYLRALGLTVLVETAIAWLWLRKVYQIRAADLPPARIIFTGVMASAVTLPHVWFLLPAFIASPRMYVWIAESLVIVVETWIVWMLLPSVTSVYRAFGLSVACNLGSYLIGKIIGF